MTDLQPLWHCPRPELAQSYLALLGAGVVTSTSIFGPRRTGKTIFLLNDLTPAAQVAGYRVAYVDLWQTGVKPALAIVKGLEECLEPKGLREKAVAKLNEPIKKLKIKGGLGEIKGEAEVEFADEKVGAAEVGLYIDSLMARLVAKGPLLLLIDEAQTLARDAANEEVARSLRTALTKHRKNVRVVYTGSNRAKLAHMFSDAEAPLYAPGMGVLDFPLLGVELVEYAAKKFDEATGGTRALNIDIGLRLLTQMQHRPQPFLKAVLLMLASPGTTLEAAAALAEKSSSASNDYQGTWNSLPAIQRELLKMSLADDFQPYAANTSQALAKALGVDRLPTTNIQRAMTSLDERNILSKSPRGSYEFEDYLLKRWLQERVD